MKSIHSKLNAMQQKRINAEGVRCRTIIQTKLILIFVCAFSLCSCGQVNGPPPTLGDLRKMYSSKKASIEQLKSALQKDYSILKANVPEYRDSGYEACIRNSYYKLDSPEELPNVSEYERMLKKSGVIIACVQDTEVTMTAYIDGYLGDGEGIGIAWRPYMPMQIYDSIDVDIFREFGIKKYYIKLSGKWYIYHELFD